MHYKTVTAIGWCVASCAGIWAYLVVVSLITNPSGGPYSIGAGLLMGFGRDVAWWSALIMTLCSLCLFEMVLKALEQSHVLRAALWRCWQSSEKVEKKGGSVREGFADWEPTLWQEMEKDSGVQAVLDKLFRKSEVVEHSSKAPSLHSKSSRMKTLAV